MVVGLYSSYPLFKFKFFFFSNLLQINCPVGLNNNKRNCFSARSHSYRRVNTTVHFEERDKGFWLGVDHR